VLPGSPAEKAGLKSGDRIRTAKGSKVKSAADLLEAVRKLPEGSSLKLSVQRGDDTTDITVELGRGL
jgi:S1-C subfamily serine protease